MTDLTSKEKSVILYRNGFIRYEDRGNINRIEARWLIYQNTPQKTARGNKPVEVKSKISRTE